MPPSDLPPLDLPPEVFNLILQSIGPSELRKSVDYLLIAKSWYHAVLPVYLSQLPLSKLYLASHHDLERLPPPDTPLSSLIQIKTERLSVRLVGHPSKCHSVAPWHDNTGLDNIDDDGLSLFGYDGKKKRDTWHCDWMTAGPVEQDIGLRWSWRREQKTLHRWAARMNRNLIELADILSASDNLLEFSLEASSEEDGEQGPRWDYVHDRTISIPISSLPVSLNNLTLDLCGSEAVTPDRERPPFHLCPLIAKRLHDFQSVRLRLRCICPEVLNASSLTPMAESKLKTLVIRLSLPYFPQASGESHAGNNKFDAKPCVATASPLYKRMIKAGVNSTKEFPTLSMMRISYREPGRKNKGICLQVADCIRKRCMFEGSSVFCYEDDGAQWDAWEDSGSLQDGGSLTLGSAL